MTGGRAIRAAEPPEDGVAFSLSVPRHAITAKARLVAGEMVVQAGSGVRAEWVGDLSGKTSYSEIHAGLIARETTKVTGDQSVFTEDFVLSPPSAAAMCGRSANGRVALKRPDAQSYAEWEAAEIAVTAL